MGVAIFASVHHHSSYNLPQRGSLEERARAKHAARVESHIKPQYARKWWYVSKGRRQYKRMLFAASTCAMELMSCEARNLNTHVGQRFNTGRENAHNLHTLIRNVYEGPSLVAK
mmetsp:Transcript_5965/g.9593  ORF Transcript_5965/g.9593 Transcript_5965/m.9593 type:complete len:114 (-) Transcript_5965:234-575(-)